MILSCLIFDFVSLPFLLSRLLFWSLLFIRSLILLCLIPLRLSRLLFWSLSLVSFLSISHLFILPVAPGATARTRIVLRCLQEAMREEEKYICVGCLGQCEKHSYQVMWQPNSVNYRSWRMCCYSCRQFKVRRPMLGGRVANWLHLEDATTSLMTEAKLELFKNLLHFSKFSAHNCLKRQPRLTCRVVVCQFSGSAPFFYVCESEAWAQYDCEIEESTIT